MAALFPPQCNTDSSTNDIPGDFLPSPYELDSDGYTSIIPPNRNHDPPESPYMVKDLREVASGHLQQKVIIVVHQAINMNQGSIAKVG